jgi:ABC-type spermidine/putrescine transport system permease subunit I
MGVEASMSAVRRLSNYILISPSIVLLGFFLILPLIFDIALSFWTYSYTGYDQVFTLQNYLSLGSPAYLQAIATTFTLSIETIVLTIVLAYPVAYTLAYKIRSTRKQTLILFALVIPFLMDYTTRTISWYPILGSAGVTNALLMDLGIIRSPVNLLFNQYAVIFVWFQAYVLFMMTPIYLALSKVNPSLVDAARSLGASSLTAFRKVTLPLSAPGMVVGAIYVLVSTVSDFPTAQLFGRGLQTVGLAIAQQADGLNWPFAAALAMVVIFVILAAVFIIIRYVDLQQLF